MNRDATIVQVALFLIVIAIVGVVILKQQNKNTAQITSNTPPHITPVLEGQASSITTGNDSNHDSLVDTGSESNIALSWEQQNHTTPVALLHSPYMALVKQYFAFIASEDYRSACALLAGGKCDNSPALLENFSKEFQKMQKGYEYINIKDYDFVAPSGKHVVCVKYSYRYKDDPRPGLISEIMAFYVKKLGGNLKITDRVCEKKYKDGRWLRDCPIEANKKFCVGLVK